MLGSIWPCCYALLQRVGVDPVSWIAASPGRAGSTFGNPIFLGGYLAVVLPLTAMLARRTRIAVPLLVLQLAALAATASRGPFVAVVAGLFVFGVVSAWSAPRGRAIAIAALVLAAVTASALAAFPSARPASISRPRPERRHRACSRPDSERGAHAHGAGRSAPVDWVWTREPSSCLSS